jgi:hypothetical protein
MKLTNPKTFVKWCEKNGFSPCETLDEAETWASECDGTYGSADFEVETGRRSDSGRVETIAFELIKPAIYGVIDGAGATVGQWSENTEWDYPEEISIENEIAEPVYRFRD